MTRETQGNGIDAAVELIMHSGFDGLGEAFRLLLNEAMRIERSRHLGAEPWERSEERRGHANGFKAKTVKSRFGELTFDVPQVRDGSFYPSALARGLRSERALKLALAEMYIQGVSTRKVAKITEELCGFEVSSTEVSRCMQLLDEELAAWRKRALGAHPYVILDARYEKVRHGGQVIDCAVLAAVGIRADGKRDILGVSVALSEAEVHWRQFLTELKDRGLHGIELFVADDHAGLKAARRALFPSVPWQRCQFHLQQNAGHYVPRQDLKAQVAREIRAVFNASNTDEANRLLSAFVSGHRKDAPKLAEWAETALPEGLTVLNFPDAFRRRLRTTNVLERLNREIKRRTRVATLFPNEASFLRLVSAVAMEISEEWLTGRTYLTIKDK